MTLVYWKRHAEINKNTETTISMNGIRVRYEAEIHQKKKQKCKPRQQTNTEINASEKEKWKNKTNKVGREINPIVNKDQEELEEVQTSPGSSDHSSQFLLPPSIDFYFNILIPECHPNFSQWCLWKFESCRTPSYPGRIECSCRPTPAFYIYSIYNFIFVKNLSYK